MRKVRVLARDNDVKIPNTSLSLFEIKNAYIETGQLAPELIEDLFEVSDFLIDRLVITESERFRNNY